MNPKVSYTLVGIFVLLLGAAMITGVVWLSTRTAEVGYDTYIAYTEESVGGLNDNAKVTFQGVQVGRVRDIDLDEDNPSQVRLELEIEQGTPVTTNTRALLVTQGITGVAHVELRDEDTGEEARPIPVDPEEGFPIIETKPSLFTRLDQSISGLVSELTEAVGSLKNVGDQIANTLSDENQAAISATLAHVAEISASMTRISATLEEITDDVATTLSNIAVASDELPDLIQRVDRTVSAYGDTAETFTGTGEAVTLTAQAITTAVNDVVDIMEDLQADFAPFSRGVPAQLVQLIGELELLVGSLQRLVQDIERDPNMLLFGRPDTVLGPGEKK